MDPYTRPRFVCDVCSKSYEHQTHLRRHQKSHAPKNVLCPECSFRTHRTDVLRKHLRNSHPESRPQNQAESTPNNQSDLRRELEALREQVRTQNEKVGQIEAFREQVRTQNEKDRQIEALQAQVRALQAEKQTTPVSQEQQPGPSTGTEPVEDVSMENTEPLEDETEQPSAENVPMEEEPESTAPENAPAEEESESTSAEWRVADFVQIVPIETLSSERTQSKQTRYRVQIAPGALNVEQFDHENFEEYQAKLTQIFTYVLQQISLEAPKDAQGWVSVDFDNLKDKKKKSNRHINVPFCPVRDITADRLMHEVEKTLNSSESIKVHNGFKIFIHYVEKTGGGAQGAAGSFGRRTIFEPQAWARRKESVIDVAKHAPAGDKMCLARCLVVGRFMAEHGKSYYSAKGYKRLVDSRPINGTQAKEALKLHRSAGVSNAQNCGLDELDRFQAVLPDHQINVYQSNCKMELIYPTGQAEPIERKRINLWLDNEHFYLIHPLQVAGFLGYAYYCHLCHKGRMNGANHLCPMASCRLCRLPNCTKRTYVPNPQSVHCDACNRDWPTLNCKVAHEETVCLKEAKCPHCWLVFPRAKLETREAHHCLLNLCYYCGEYRKPGHVDCFLQRPKYNVPEEEDAEPTVEEGDQAAVASRAERPKQKMIYADIECEVHSETHQHLPILMCMCDEQGAPMKPYRGEGCVDMFVKDLIEVDSFKNSCIVYHNMAAYDGMFILNACFKRGLDPNAIFRGSRVLSINLKQRNIKIIDSYLHLSMALSRLPFAYNFELEVLKGNFPVLLPNKQNRGAVFDKFPEEHFFDPEHMSAKKYEAFSKWHAEKCLEYANNPSLRYDLDAEMEAYCQDDCLVLCKGFEAYRKTYMGLYNNIDPAQMLTLPSFVAHCYRAVGMPKDSISVLPPRGFDCSKKQSKEAIYWLEFESKRRGWYIRHCRNAIAEVKVGPHYCDGFYDPENGEPATVLEYQGCIFHGCDSCYADDREKMFKGKTMAQRYQETLRKEKYLKDRGYNVVTMWACQFKAWRSRDPELDGFVSDLEKHEDHKPLCARDALRGGRTNCARLAYVPKEGEELKYLDFTSLYPSCQMGVKGQQYPIGVPKVYLHSFPPVAQWFGIAKVVLDPPKQMVFPVTPSFSGGKVIFGLCGTCIKQVNNKTKCTHEGAARHITDTYATPEILEALERGYELVDIIELWQWEERSGELFRDFLKKSYAEKVAASGWPKQYTTEEQRRAFLKRYKDEQGIDISYESVKENKALRENSKLTINNNWGYFGKDISDSKTEFVTSYAKFLEIQRDKTKDIKATYLVSDCMMAVETRTAADYLKPDPKTNTMLAVMTTCFARLQLYELLEFLGDRVLYFDTDSVIYIERQGQPSLVTGPLLGDLTDEVLQKFGPRAKIASFHSGGSKTYLLQIVDRETNEPIDVIMKHKGLRANRQTAAILNPQSMVKVIEEDSVLEVPQMNMIRNRKVGSVQTRYMHKRLRVNFTKRIQTQSIEDMSLPIGYKD